MKTKSLQALAISFALGGVWDSFAAYQYLFRIGTGRPIDVPPIDPFYAIFLGSFFLCFAWLQILASTNIRRYAFCVGCLIFGRLFYIATLGSFLAFVPGFPLTFWFTGIIDCILILLSLFFAYKAGLHPRDIFLPALNPLPLEESGHETHSFAWKSASDRFLPHPAKTQQIHSLKNLRK